jgi:hypothetical protein
MIEQQSYFVLHAPRQVGKTAAMMGLAKELTASGKFVSAVLSLEIGRGLKNNLGAAELAILGEWRFQLEHQLTEYLMPPPWPESDEGQRISGALTLWAKTASRPVVAFLDEIDSLEDEALISVLRQLRSGFPRRPSLFPSSLAVIGLRDVRDYKVLSGGSSTLGTGSSFNIAVRSITLRNFNAEEVRELIGLHTVETGQQFTPSALKLIFEMTEGQP